MWSYQVDNSVNIANFVRLWKTRIRISKGDRKCRTWKNDQMLKFGTLNSELLNKTLDEQDSN